MRLRFSEIEEAKKDPVAYRARKMANKGTPIPPYPHRYVELAIHAMHKDGRDVALVAPIARAALVTKLSAKFPNNAKAAAAADDFDRYVQDYLQRGDDYVTGWRNVSVPLPPRYSPDLSVGGRIMRIDLSTDGYGAWIFSRYDRDWDNDRRLPLIQAAVAAELGVDVEEVTAGVYSFEDGQHHPQPYTAPQVAAAIQELCSTLDLLV